MRKSIWCNADKYGQLAVWIFSVLPFLYFFREASKKGDFYMLLLIHGFGLMVIGLWQVISTMINFLYANTEHKPFFGKNIWVGLVLVLVFFVWVYSGNFSIQLPASQYHNIYFVAGYFLMVDIAVFRYWRYIHRYYKQISHA